MQEFIDKLRAEFPVHHIEIQIYPSGGIIDANACDECGSTESDTSSWRYGKGRLQTFDDAVADLRKKLTPSNAGGNATERSEGRVDHNVGRLAGKADGGESV